MAQIEYQTIKQILLKENVIMRKYLTLAFLIIVFYSWATHENYVQGKADSPMDIVIVLDNSDKMKANDPGFLMNSVVSSFLGGLPKDSHISLIIFDRISDLAVPPTSVGEDGVNEKIAKALSKIDYRGKDANTPEAIELAVYLLKRSSRADAEKLIIFVADGGINTRDEAETIIERIKAMFPLVNGKAGIRIFGIAFANQADSEFIKYLGKETNGGYYQALKAEDIQIGFNNISETIGIELKQELKPPSPIKVKVPVEKEKGVSMEWLLLIGLVILILLGGVVVVLVIVSKKGEAKKKSNIVQARLVDMDGVTGRKSYKLDKDFTTIGRLRDNDICIPKSTMSGEHAQIECKNRHFYLTDLNSKNGTYINNGNENISGEVHLKNGDIISFDKYKFRFALPGQTKRTGAPSHQQTIMRYRD